MLSLYHPELDTTISVREHAAYLYRESGWVDAESDVLQEDTVLEREIELESEEEE